MEKDMGAKLILSKEDKPLGTVGSIKLLENQIKEPFLVMNGDILSLVDFAKFYDFSVPQDSLFTVGIKDNYAICFWQYSF